MGRDEQIAWPRFRDWKVMEREDLRRTEAVDGGGLHRWRPACAGVTDRIEQDKKDIAPIVRCRSRAMQRLEVRRALVASMMTLKRCLYWPYTKSDT
jgi:hypothetical protein